MIRIEIDEQGAVDLHGLVERLRAVMAERMTPEEDSSLRNAALALSGGLRAHGWTPEGEGWAKRPVRSRR